VKKAHDEVFELFFDLGASEEQLNFETVYAIGREGTAKMKMEDENSDQEKFRVQEQKYVSVRTERLGRIRQVEALLFHGHLRRVGLSGHPRSWCSLPCRRRAPSST
jgi:hypothetical protein